MGHPQYFATRSGLPYCCATKGRPLYPAIKKAFNIYVTKVPPRYCATWGVTSFPQRGTHSPSVFCKLGRPHYLQARASCKSCNLRNLIILQPGHPQYPATRDAKSSCNQRLPQLLATMAALIPFFHQGSPQYHAGRDALSIIKGVPTCGVPNILQPGGVPST